MHAILAAQAIGLGRGIIQHLRAKATSPRPAETRASSFPALISEKTQGVEALDLQKLIRDLGIRDGNDLKSSLFQLLHELLNQPELSRVRGPALNRGFLVLKFGGNGRFSLIDDTGSEMSLIRFKDAEALARKIHQLRRLEEAFNAKPGTPIEKIVRRVSRSPDLQRTWSLSLGAATL